MFWLQRWVVLSVSVGIRQNASVSLPLHTYKRIGSGRKQWTRWPTSCPDPSTVQHWTKWPWIYGCAAPGYGTVWNSTGSHQNNVSILKQLDGISIRFGPIGFLLEFYELPSPSPIPPPSPSFSLVPLLIPTSNVQLSLLHIMIPIFLSYSLWFEYLLPPFHLPSASHPPLIRLPSASLPPSLNYHRPSQL